MPQTPVPLKLMPVPLSVMTQKFGLQLLQEVMHYTLANGTSIY